jgi:HSP20 family molecular chaperone IbpA
MEVISCYFTFLKTGKAFEMSLVAPGLRKEDFKLNVTGGLLTISYEHKEEQKEENRAEDWLKTEYKMQSFSRNFNLDDPVDVTRFLLPAIMAFYTSLCPKKKMPSACQRQ